MMTFSILLLLALICVSAGKIPCKDNRSCSVCVKDGDCVYGIGKKGKTDMFSCFDRQAADDGQLLGFVRNNHQCPAEESYDTGVEDDSVYHIPREAANTYVEENVQELPSSRNDSGNATTQKCPGPRKIYLLEEPWFVPGLIVIWLASMFFTVAITIAIWATWGKCQENQRALERELEDLTRFQRPITGRMPIRRVRFNDDERTL